MRTKPQDSKKKILDFYENLFNDLWEKFLPTLGITSIEAITKCAQGISSKKYKILDNLIYLNDKCSFKKIRKNLNEIDIDILEAALTNFIEEFINIIVLLTGEIIVKKT